MKRVDLALTFVLLLLVFSPFAFADLMSFQGKALDQGVLVDSGNITVSIYDSPSGGNLIYDESFTGVIQGGFFDVVLGNSTPLNLNLGDTYWVDLSINGNDIDWQGQERKVFESAVGNINQSSVLPSCNDGETLEYNVSSSSWVCSVSGEVIPIGSVMAFSQDSCPTGWLLADGSDVIRVNYLSLFSAIGTMYGSGDGSTTFNLPDYRGYFLRGTDNGAGNDPDAASRTDRGDGTTGDNVGTVQADGLSSHLHSVNPPSTTSSSISDHVHSVNPPSTTSSTDPNHRHTVDPPAATSGSNSADHTHSVNPDSYSIPTSGSHSHPYLVPRYGSDVDRGTSLGSSSWSIDETQTRDTTATSHSHTVDLPAKTSTANSVDHTHSINIGSFYSGYDGSHSHTTDIAPFDSIGAGGHSHTTDIAAFDSASAGGSEVRPKNVNVLYCIKAAEVVTVVDDQRFSAVGNSVYLTNLSDNLGIGTDVPSYKLDVNGTGRFTGTLITSTVDTGQGSYEINSIAQYQGDQNLRTTDSPTFGAELTLTESSPQLRFNDPDSGEDDFWIHVNSNNFYVLTDRDDDGAWESPHPLQLEADTNAGYMFGSKIWTQGNDGSGSGLDADTVDGISSATLRQATSCNGDSVCEVNTISDSDVGTIRDNNGGWVRTYGDTGWYSQTHGGGWYMTDSNYVRTYGGKSIYTTGSLVFSGTDSIYRESSGIIETMSRFRVRGPANDARFDLYASSGDNSILSFMEASLGSTIRWNIWNRGSDDAFIIDTGGYGTNYAYMHQTGSGWTTPSDIRYKHNISSITGVLDKIEGIDAVRYIFENNTNYHIGLIAQDVIKEFPEIVENGSDGYLGLSYARTGPIAIQAVKELRAEKDIQIKDLDDKIKRLEDQNHQLRMLVCSDKQQAEICN